MTTYVQTPYLEFRELLQQQVKELEKARPERYSTEWFYWRYVRRLSKRALAATSPRDLNGAMRGFIRFYVDSIEAPSALAERFEAVLSAHRHALRLERVE